MVCEIQSERRDAVGIQREVERVLKEARETIPGFEIRYKDEHGWHRFIGMLMSPINNRYMTEYTTVFYPHVYFPSEAFYERLSPKRRLATLRHELVHLQDYKRFGWLFAITYLLVLPTMFTLRAVWEMRGYRENLRVELWLWGKVTDCTIDRIVERFVGPDYFFMLPFRGLVRAWISRECRQLSEGRV